MVLNAQSRPVSFAVMKKKKDLPNPLDIEVAGPDLWRQFWKNQNFCFYGPNAQVRTCELCGHDKKKKKISTIPSTSKSIFRKF